MSEKDEKTENSKDEGLDIVDTNIAIMKSKIINMEKQLATKDALIDELTAKLEKANSWIEEDEKKMLLAEITPMVETPDELLALKSVSELRHMLDTLKVARPLVFKSGTPINYGKQKANQRKELDNLYGDYIGKLYGGKVK